MANKNVIVILLLGVIVLAGVTAYLYDQNSRLKAVEKQNQQNTPPANAVRMSVVTVAQTDSFYSIRAEYPQFDGADPAFNQEIANLVNGQIDQFKKEAKDNFDARNATMPEGQPVLQNPEQPFDFIATWMPSQSGPRYESFMIDIYYFSGGAHGADKMYAFNYDILNKKEITINDFLGSADNLNKLAELAKAQVSSQLQASGMLVDESVNQMIADGTKPTEDNYRNFTFGYGKMTIYFEQYQVAPGSAGAVIVTFYKNELDQNSINSSYLD